MRIAKLVVEAFQGIERAEIELGPGLNILYGPNDLGKSTLASAIRAALLVLPKSSEVRSFSPWYADAVPRVTLTFVDPDNRHWMIIKRFGEGAVASAELMRSNDGRTFSVECRSREVDEKVRALLGWGIPAPGGKGAPRGLPDSFLAQVLLAAQTDVDKILGASLEMDPDESGKLRLQKALATLAEDPLFKSVVNEAQREYDAYFTPKGARKRGQGTRAVDADQAVKRHQAELQSIQRELAESSAAEGAIVRLRQARDEAATAVADAETRLRSAQAGLSNSRARRGAQEALESAEKALAAIDSQVEEVRQLELSIEALDRRAHESERALANAQAELESAEALVRKCEEAHRVVISGAGEQERATRTAELKTKLAQIESSRVTLQTRREGTERALHAKKKAAEAKEHVDEVKRRQLRKETEVAEKSEHARAADLELARSRELFVYARWRAAQDLVRRAQDAAQKAAEGRSAAAADRAEATQLSAECDQREAELAVRRATLPSDEQLRALQGLEKKLEIAEAALGGGMTLSVRSRKEVALIAAIDNVRQEKEAPLIGERTFEAQRSIQLSLGDDVDVDVLVGSLQARRAMEELKARRQSEVLPVLMRTGLPSLVEVADAIHAVAREEQTLRAVREKAASLRREADVKEGNAEQWAQAQPPPSNEDLAARQAAIVGVDVAACEVEWSRQGGGQEAHFEARHRQHERTAVEVREQLTTLKQQLELARHESTQAEATFEERHAELAAQLTLLGTDHPEIVLQEVSNAERVLARDAEETQRELRLVGEEASAALISAEHALAEARVAAEKAVARCAEAQSERDAHRATHLTKKGELSAQAEALTRLDRAAAVAMLESQARLLAGLPEAPLAEEHEVEAAAAAVARCKRLEAERNEELHKAEGALMTVGGIQLRERAQQAEEALEAARMREKEVHIEAKAWKLLRDALRDAESKEGAHLGRALEGPVGERFAELTEGRYGGLSFDPVLRAEGVRAAGASGEESVLQALSVGTRDQLATLMRLTIAAQLKTAIVLDDHLVHTDPVRLMWFQQALTKTALETQVLIFTCRPEDYLQHDQLPTSGATRDLAGGSVRAIDLTRVVKRWERSIVQNPRIRPNEM